MPLMPQRIRRLNAIALALALTYAFYALNFTLKTVIVSQPIDFVFIYVTSVGFYQFIINLIYRMVEASPILMRLYWGRFHVSGLWSYTYTLEGTPVNNTVYFGIWRFEQDLYKTRVVGFGLTDSFTPRSHVRSVTDIVDNGGVYEVINIRSDSVDSRSEYYSRNTMFFELSRKRVFRRPIRMRGKTFVYGGPLTGKICNNSFIRHEDARTEQDVIDRLRTNLRDYGLVHPEQLHSAPPNLAPPSPAP
jgi:hypothetical protein